MATDAREAEQFAREVVGRLREAGYQALWAGGCVRDRLLGEAAEDYDVATDAPPDEIRRLFGHRRTLAIGAAFGVITVLGPRRRSIEVATFRRDANYSDGRHPDGVTFSSAEEDARRRDFTINGIFYDPLEDRIIDYVGGQADLRAGLVRAIGDPHARLAEDKLRMLRAVRFAAAYDFRLDPPTLAAIGQHPAEITIVSAERVAAELRRMLTDRRRARALRLLQDTGLLEVLVPESRGLCPPPPGMPPDTGSPAWVETLRVLESLRAPSFSLALAGLLRRMLDPAGPAALARRVCQRWRLSNRETERTAWLLAHESTIAGAAARAWSMLQPVLAAPGREELLELCAAVAAATGQGADDVVYCRARIVLPADQLDPPPLITGDDLLGAGIPRGAVYRRLLQEARSAQLDGLITTRQQALDLARRSWQTQLDE